MRKHKALKYVIGGVIGAAVPALLTTGSAFAEDKDATTLLMESTNLLWVVIGAILVIFMQAGFALVETGFTQKKNAAHVMSTNFAIFGLGFVGFLVIGFPAGIPKIPLNLTLLKSCQIVGVFWGAFVAKSPKENEANVAELFDLYAKGKIKPRVSAHFPLERGAEAIQHLADRKVQGKVVVTIG